MDGSSCRTLFFALAPLLLASGGANAQDYYDGVDASSPEALRATLHEIIDDHTRIPYTASSTDTWDVLEDADRDQDEPGRVTTVYRNASYPAQGGGNSFYNREHLWPVSYGFPDRDDPDSMPFTDMHALFLSDIDYNASRENKPFDNCGGGCSRFATETNDGRGGGGDDNFSAGAFTDGTWEVWSERRGDVARALLYMDVRYEGGTHNVTGVSEPDLILTDSLERVRASQTGSNESVAYMAYLSTLLAWHEEDPVDAIERQRNDVVGAAQGNRNPFIDHPEWARCIFSGDCNSVLASSTCQPAPELIANLPVDEALACPGFYIGTVRDEGAGGRWGMELALSAGERLLQGGLNLGAGFAGADRPGFAAFNIANAAGEPQQVIIDITYATSSSAGYDLTVNRIDEGVETRVFEALVTGDRLVETLLLDPGFHVFATSARDGATGSANIALTTQYTDRAGGAFQGGVVVGGFIAQPGGQGFAALCVSEAQPVRFSTFARSEYGAGGSESLRLAVLDRDSTQLAASCDNPPPNAPTGVAAQGEADTVVISWLANTEPDLFGYEVFRSTRQSVPERISPRLGATTFTDRSVLAGVAYRYEIRAFDQAGNASLPSAPVEAQIETPAGAAAVWINEFHYDNGGADENEFIEVAGTAETALDGWRLIGYNGNGGASYANVTLDGSIPSQANGFGTLAVDFIPLQNGSPDGIALVDPDGVVREFISYEGTFVAVDGPANGLRSVDVGVRESSNSASDRSLQRTGTGSVGTDFTWTGPIQASRGAPNAGQMFQR